MSKWYSVVYCILASCVLLLGHHVLSKTRRDGPLVHGGKPVSVLDIAGLVGLPDAQHSGASGSRASVGLGLVGTEGGRGHGPKTKVGQLFEEAMRGSTEVSEGSNEDDDSEQYGDDGEPSIADIWAEDDEHDALWSAYEEEYAAMKWERIPDAFRKWRGGLERYGVDSRRGFLVSHDSVELHQVLPFYMSTQHTYTTSELFMRLIPKESPYTEKSLGRCAVVGNSGILRNSACGRQIDSADYVFRCNIPPIDEYEHDVGVKTNVTTMNPSMLIFDHGTVSLSRKPDYPFNLVLEPYDGVIMLPCFSHFFYLRQCFKALRQYYRQNAIMTFLHPEHFISVWDYWRDRGLINVPSTGFYIVSTAATLCDQVDLYGFWPFEKTGFPGRTDHVMYHYWEDGQWGPAHDKSREFALLFDMHRQGALKMHLGNCSASRKS